MLFLSITPVSDNAETAVSLMFKFKQELRGCGDASRKGPDYTTADVWMADFPGGSALWQLPFPPFQLTFPWELPSPNRIGKGNP